jgi:two-component system phosphate regulon response regulator PhoB
LRSLVFRFEDISAFSAALADAHGSLTLPDGETVFDGEWVLAIFEIGSRKRATAAAARGVRAAGDPHIAFERRDWDRLLAFVAARSEHMRAAKPISTAPSASPSTAPAAGAASASARAAASARGGANLDADSPLSEIPPSSVVPLSARILLVDDDPATRDEVRAMLAEVGLVVEVVESATEASSRMAAVAFDALVLDWSAPGMQALDFVRGLRRDPKRAPLPVLFLSDRPSSRDVVEAFASGADDFLPKPFRAPELGARIFGLLRRARAARANARP